MNQVRPILTSQKKTEVQQNRPNFLWNQPTFLGLSVNPTEALWENVKDFEPS